MYYCGLNTSILEKKTEFSMLHRNLIFSFVYWYNRQDTIIADDIYIYLRIELASTATTYL